MIALKRILVATDFGEPADAALTYGRALARTFGATLHVLHVVENVFLRAMGSEIALAASPSLQREIEESARKRLTGLLVDNDPEPLPTEAVVLASNAPAATIVEYAREHAIDLIVMGTHGRGPIAHFFMGSVAERVVRTASCPVLTVRHPEHEFVVADALVAVERT